MRADRGGCCSRWARRWQTVIARRIGDVAAHHRPRVVALRQRPAPHASSVARLVGGHRCWWASGGARTPAGPPRRRTHHRARRGGSTHCGSPDTEPLHERDCPGPRSMTAPSRQRKLVSGWLTWCFRVARRAGCSLRSVHRSVGSATPTRSRMRFHPSTRFRGVRGASRSWRTGPRSARYAAERFLRIPCRHRLHLFTKSTSAGE